MDDQEMRNRAKRTIDSLTRQGLPAPNYDELIASSTPKARARRGPLFAVATLVALVALGGVFAAIRSDRSTTGTSSVICGEIVAINGRMYLRDSYNDDAVPVGDLGKVVGVVDQAWECDDTNPENRTIPDAGIVASLLAPGTELRSIGTDPDSSVVAAVSGGQVTVYVAVTGDRLKFTAEVSEIGINSGFDGITRFATIDDPLTIAMLMETARSGAVTDRLDDETDLDDRQYFVELVRTDGLRTLIPYWIDEEILGDRTVSDTWALAVRDALAVSPDQPLVTEIALTDGDITVSFHPNGGCRRDRPDLEVSPNQTLALIVDPAVQLSFLFVTSQPIDPKGGDPSDAFAPDVGPTLRIPDSEGTLIVEATLTRADGTTFETCVSLQSTVAQ